MENNESILEEIKSNLEITTKPVEYINTSKMSKKEKDEVIKELQDKIHNLESKLLIRESFYKRYTSELIQSRYDETMKLLNDPVLTLPSGTQLFFSSLSDEQLQYLESLANKNNKTL